MLCQRHIILICYLLFHNVLLSRWSFMTFKTQKHYIMRPVTFQLIREILSVEWRYHMESWVFFVFAAYHAFILSVCKIKIVVIYLLIRLALTSPIWLKPQLNGKRLITNFISKFFLYVPLCLLGIAIWEKLSIRSNHFAVFINCFLASVLLDDFLLS